MELALLVYAISVIDKLGYLLSVVTFFGSFVTIGLILGHFAARSEARDYGTASDEKVEQNWWVKMTKRFAIISGCLVVFSTLVNIVIPTERTAYIMVGAYAAQQVAESETTKKILDVVNKKLEHALDEAMEEIQESKPKKRK